MDSSRQRLNHAIWLIKSLIIYNGFISMAKNANKEKEKGY
jgi:hypothetical protein